MTDVRRALSRVVRLLVDRPDDVGVEEESRPQGLTLKLRVAPEDLGQVIGRQGRTARALRSLLAERGGREGARVELEVRED